MAIKGESKLDKMIKNKSEEQQKAFKKAHDLRFKNKLVLKSGLTGAEKRRRSRYKKKYGDQIHRLTLVFLNNFVVNPPTKEDAALILKLYPLNLFGLEVTNMMASEKMYLRGVVNDSRPSLNRAGDTLTEAKMLRRAMYLEDKCLKYCAKCAYHYDYDGFYKNKRQKDGLDTVCKECRKGYNNDKKPSKA